MTLHEYRASQDGRCVKDWEACCLFLMNSFLVIRNRAEMFWDENPTYNKQYSSCVFCRGFSPQTPPRIVIEFSKNGIVFTDEDNTRILTLMHKLTSWRGNLKFDSLMGPFHCQFEIKIKSYRPFMDRQPEIDLFSPLGGNASPPDPSLYYERQKFLWVQPWFPPKGNQRLLDLGAFVCGNTTHRLSDISPPNVIFSDLDPGEVKEKDDIPFEWPPSPEKSWQQLEFPYTTAIPIRYGQDEISAPKTMPFVSALRGLLRKIVGKFVGFWRRIFS